MPEHYKPEWLDRMYNNRELVPDHGDYFVRWAADSALACEAGECEIDISYGDAPGEKLDVFRASGGRAGAPVMVFIHGGYWRSLDKSQHSFIAPVFNKAGACVVMPNYALCPAVTIPDIVIQMVKALEWTWRNIARYGGDPKRITVVGHSAGGHLVAMLLACLWQKWNSKLPADLVKKGLSLSGLYDLLPVMHTPFLKESLRLTEADAVKASPAFMPAPRGATMYSVAGADESPEFLRHNNMIQDVWGRKVVPVCESHLRCNHFSIVDALVQPNHRLHKLALELMQLS